MAPPDVGAEILQDAHHTGALRAVAVGGHGHEIHFQRQIDGADEVAGEHRPAAQDGHDHNARIPGNIGIVASDGLAQLAHAYRQILLGEKYL